MHPNPEQIIHYAMTSQESFCGFLVPPFLNENIEFVTILIDSSPQVMLDTIDLDEDFIQIPGVAQRSPALFDSIGVFLTKLLAPLAYGFVAD